MAYRLEGSILEVCTCSAICPCWVGQDPDGGVWVADSGNNRLMRFLLPPSENPVVEE